MKIKLKTLRRVIREALDPNACPDCMGSGEYVGFNDVEPCKSCAGSGKKGGASTTSEPEQAFYYNSRGHDSNGNMGPMASDPGWIKVTGRNANDAISKLPPQAKQKVMKKWNELKVELKDDQSYPPDDFENCVAATGGEGWDFSWYNEDEMQNERAEEERD